VAIHARELDRSFIGFAARVAEEDLVHARYGGKTIGGCLSFGNAVDIGCMHQARDLRCKRGCQARMIVTQGIHGDAGQGIEVGLALLIE